MSNTFSREDVERSLARLQADVGRIADALLEMDGHPGHVLLRDAALTGDTRRRWAHTQTMMATLWDRYAQLRAILARALAVRARRSRPGGAELAELTELLAGPVVELDAQHVPIERRGLTGASVVYESVTLADLVARMQTEFDAVIAVLVAAQTTWREAVDRLDAAVTALREVTALAASTDAGTGPATALAAALSRVREATLTDILAPTATAALADIERRIAALRAELSVAVQARAAFADRIAGLEHVVTELEAAEAQAETAYTAVRRTIADPGIPAPDDGGARELRTRLARLLAEQQNAGWDATAAAAAELERLATETLAATAASVHVSTGLLDRRAELRGRLDAYEAKAARLGRAEDAELARLRHEARRLLYAVPSDLAAATRAVNTYRRAVAAPPTPAMSVSGDTDPLVGTLRWPGGEEAP